MRKPIKKSKMTYRHGNLREAILVTSLHMIEHGAGAESLSLREIAKKAGVTHQAPYRHFKDREALLAALAQDGFEKLFSSMSETLALETTPFNRLLKLGESYLTWASIHPSHFRLMFSHSIPEYEVSQNLQLATKNVLDLVVSVVSENQDAKILRKDDARSLARQFWSAVHGVSILFIDRQFKPLNNDLKSGQHLVKEIVTNLANGLKPK